MHLDVVVDFLSFEPQQLTETWNTIEGLCKQYIFISSCCVFRRAEEDGIIDENSPKPNKILPYSINKYECEKQLIKLSEKSMTKYTIVRPYITYGDTRIPFGIAPYGRKYWSIAARINAGKPMFSWDGGMAKCSILHTKDFAQVFYKLLCNNRAMNEDVNITSMKVYTWKEVTDTIYKCLNCEPNIVDADRYTLSKAMPNLADFILGDRALQAIFSHDKLFRIVPEAKQILNDTISLEVGISDAISNYKSHNYYSGIDYQYDGIIDRTILKIHKFRGVS